MSRLGDGGYLSSPISAAAETTWQLAVRWRDAGLSATASTIVDLTAPSFSVSWPAPPVRLVDVDGGLDQRDPADADAGTTSWRRDETALIRISSAASDIDPSTVRLRVAGYDVPLADAGVCVSTGGYCRVASAELWRPTWRMYRGTMPVEISAADDVGNAAMTDGGQLRVTRWRWRIDLPNLQDANRASIVGIDHAGTIYAVTSRPDGGSLNAYAPTGELVYRRATVGRPFPPVIGAVAGPNGVMGYITEAVGSGQVSGVAYGLANANTPAIVWQSPAPRPNYNMPVVTSSVARNVETAFLSWIDPSSNKPTIGWGAVVGLEAATDGGIRVPAAPGTAATLGALVASGRTLYVPDFDSNTVFAFETSNNFTFPSESNLGFPGTAGGLLGIFHLVVDASGALVGSGPATNGTRAFRLTYPTTTTLGPTSTSPFIVLLVRGTTLFLVRADDIGGSQTRGRVCTGTLGGTPVCSSNDAEDVFPLDMALGEGDILYTVAQDVASGRASLQARDATTLAVLWSVPAADSPVHGLTLDCRQPGAGTLIGQGSGSTVEHLFALIVDSRGVDATADWPLIRHDPRNSNDRASSLVPFTCP